ncbi:MAG: hypothetical protein H0T62_02480 [Parachlamydiaceae bacterium]|nr:hypothetical protein [Parachlamydiaceae bacterium]
MNFFNINFDQNQAQLFIAGPQQIENKVVLKVDEYGLRFVRLTDTSFFEVVQAWFGYGPLSLTNIVDFISKNAEAVNEALEDSQVSKKAFLTKIRDAVFHIIKNI